MGPVNCHRFEEGIFWGFRITDITFHHQTFLNKKFLLYQSYYIKERHPSSRVKEDIVNYSKLKWPLLFSRFYEAFRSSGNSQVLSLSFQIHLFEPNSRHV
jgi:hypothetical protein